MLNSQSKNRLQSANCGLNGEVDAEHIATTPPPQPNSRVKSTHYNDSPTLLTDVRKFAELLRRGEIAQNGKIFGTTETNTLKAWCLFGVPLITKQFNPNFKVKWHVGPWPLMSLNRRPSLQTVKKETHNRSSCLYLSLGSLPFYDNGLGVLFLTQKDCRHKRLKASSFKTFDADKHLKAFQAFKAPPDFLLHRIITEESSKFRKPRDGCTLSNQLRYTSSFNSIFTFPKAIEDTEFSFSQHPGRSKYQWRKHGTYR